MTNKTPINEDITQRLLALDTFFSGIAASDEKVPEFEKIELREEESIDKI